ncbi:MAG: Arm DNA-binding domain-containing protein [Panacagrimonas sp.]
MSSIRTRPNGKLFFDFRHQGKRCREITALDDTPANRKKMEAVMQKIEAEITLGTFDYARFFPGSDVPVRGDGSVAGGQSFTVLHKEAPMIVTPAFRDFVETWQREKEIEWRQSYRDSVQCILDCHLLPAFGDVPVGAIDRAAALQFRATLGEKRIGSSMKSPRALTSSTINKVMGIARMILEEAGLRHGFANPFVSIKRLKNKRIDVEPFSMDEVKLILDTVRPDYRGYLTVRFFTGLRSGEIHGLKWKHIDMDRREILVRETWTGTRTEYTKTDGSQREVAMAQPVFDALQACRPKKCDPESYVFRNKAGTPIDNKNFQRRVWDPLLRLLGMKVRRPYQMRHTCATLWLAAGENPEWIARQLGHTTTEMLFRTYSRYVPNLTRNDGSAFDGLVSAAVLGGVKDAPDAANDNGPVRKRRGASHGR